MVQQSQPYAPGANPVYTTYAYDALGRTTRITLPDGASQTQYRYQGNVTTVTDPAGKWKQYFSDAFGNLAAVLEPDPAANPVPAAPNPPPAYPVTSAPQGMLLTSYTYDPLNHLIQVSMPHNVGGTMVTQTRTFTYDPATQRLVSVTNPENGTVQYTYNADGTLATKTDAKRNMESYSYDSLQRLTAIHRWVFNNGQLTEDSAQLQTFTYDDSDTGGGRLSQAGFGGPVGPSQLQFSYLYSYTPAGNVAWRRLLLSEPGSYTAGLDVSYTYDNEGNVTSIKYPDTQPDANTAVTGPTYTYALDGLKRPVGLTDNSGGTWASGVTYNAANQMTGGTFGPGAWSETRTYNSLLQLTREQQTSSQLGVLMDMTYTYSSNQNNGQVAQTVDAVSGETISYQYDLNPAHSSPTGAGRRPC
jgi:YD repeat-containing protein